MEEQGLALIRPQTVPMRKQGPRGGWGPGTSHSTGAEMSQVTDVPLLATLQHHQEEMMKVSITPPLCSRSHSFSGELTFLWDPCPSSLGSDELAAPSHLISLPHSWTSWAHEWLRLSSRARQPLSVPAASWLGWRRPYRGQAGHGLPAQREVPGGDELQPGLDMRLLHRHCWRARSRE